jgi:hypothetical protein
MLVGALCVRTTFVIAGRRRCEGDGWIRDEGCRMNHVLSARYETIANKWIVVGFDGVVTSGWPEIMGMIDDAGCEVVSAVHDDAAANGKGLLIFVRQKAARDMSDRSARSGSV